MNRYSHESSTTTSHKWLLYKDVQSAIHSLNKILTNQEVLFQQRQRATVPLICDQQQRVAVDHDNISSSSASGESLLDTTGLSSLVSGTSSSDGPSSLTATIIATMPTGEFAAVVAKTWNDLGRVYRSLEQTLKNIKTENSYTNTTSISSNDEFLSNLMTIVRLAAITMLNYWECQPTPQFGDQLEARVGSVCAIACEMLANDVVTVSSENINLLVDDVASLLQTAVNQSGQTIVAPSQQLQPRQPEMLTPILQLIHSNLSRSNAQCEFRFEILESQETPQLPPLPFPSLEPSASVTLLRCVLAVVIGMLRYYPWRFCLLGSSATRDYEDDMYPKDLRMELVTFCNYVLGHVLTLSQQDDDNPEWERWLHHWMTITHINLHVNEPLPSHRLAQVVSVERAMLQQWLCDYVVESMEYALDVIEGASVLFLSASSPSSCSRLDSETRGCLWEEVLRHTRLALDASQLILQRIPGNSQNKRVCKDIFLSDTIARDHPQSMDRWISILHSTWSNYANVVATYLTDSDDPKIRVSTTQDLIQMAYLLATLSTTPLSVTKVPSCPHRVKATTLLRMLEYPNITNDYVLQTLLEYWNCSDPEWKALLQAAAMSRCLLGSQQGQQPQYDPVLSLLLQASARAGSDAGARNGVGDDPWQTLLMAKMASYNVITSSTAGVASFGAEND